MQQYVRQYVRWLVLGLVIAASTQAQAQGAAVRTEADEWSRQFDQAEQSFKNREYNAALAGYKAAYQIRPSAELLYNIGITQRALFRYVEAIESLERYLGEQQNATAGRRAEVKQAVSQMRELLSETVLHVQPEGATVTLDGRRLGKAPLGAFKLAAGYHVLTVDAVDYEPQSRDLVVVGGKPTEETVTLTALPRNGLARIVPSPALALVAMDGKTVGTGAVELELAPGNHRLAVSAPGYRTVQSDVLIGVREQHTINLELIPLPKKTPVYRRWWLWTLVGAAAAGTATGVAVPLTSGPQGPLPGTLGTSRAN